MEFRARIDTGGMDVRARIGGGADLRARMSPPVVERARPDPPYEGAYEVTPLPHEQQVLPTAHRGMERDVTVYEIPYYQTSNPAGGYTAIIGD